MFRCLKPGCPVRCGSRRTPSCSERTIFWILFSVLTTGLVVSLIAGAVWLHQAADPKAGPASEPDAEPAAGARKGSPLFVYVQPAGPAAVPAALQAAATSC